MGGIQDFQQGLNRRQHKLRFAVPYQLRLSSTQSVERLPSCFPLHWRAPEAHHNTLTALVPLRGETHIRKRFQQVVVPRYLECLKRSMIMFCSFIHQTVFNCGSQKPQHMLSQHHSQSRSLGGLPSHNRHRIGKIGPTTNCQPK